MTLISLTLNSLDDSGQHRTEMFLALSKIESRLFSLYHSFSNADLEQKQTFDAAYGKITRTLNSIRAPLSSAQEITKANLGIFTTDLLALESDLDAFTTLGLGYTLKASNFEQDAIASDLRQLAIVTSLLIFVLIGVSIAMLKMYRGALLNERISDNTRQRFEAMISNSLDAVIPKPVDNMKLLARLDHFIRADETASTDSDIPQRPMSGPINLQIHAENSDMLGSERWKGLVGRMVQEVDEMFAFFETERACELGRELLANKVHEAAGVAGQAGAEAVKSDLLEIERVIRNTDAENVLERLKKAKPNWENAKVSLADYGYLVAS